MNQNIYTKSYQNVFSYKQANPLVVNNQYDKEKSLQRNNKRKSSDSKKSVTFNENVQIEYVESWKKYNTDVSNETEYGKLKKEIMELKKNKQLGINNNECICIVF